MHASKLERSGAKARGLCPRRGVSAPSAPLLPMAACVHGLVDRRRMDSCLRPLFIFLTLQPHRHMIPCRTLRFAFTSNSDYLRRHARTARSITCLAALGSLPEDTIFTTSVFDSTSQICTTFIFASIFFITLFY